MRSNTVNKKNLIIAALTRALMGLSLLWLMLAAWSMTSYAGGEASFTPSVEVVFENADSLDESLKKATFTLTAIDAAPMPATGSNVSRLGSGKLEFGEIKYALPGTYSYQIKQLEGTTLLMTYDTTPRKLVVFVYYDDADVMHATANAVIISTGAKGDLVFKNIKQNLSGGGSGNSRSGGGSGGSSGGSGSSSGGSSSSTVSGPGVKSGSGEITAATISDSNTGTKNGNKLISRFLPKTGDEGKVELALAVMILALAGIFNVLMLIWHKKRHTDDSEES